MQGNAVIEVAYRAGVMDPTARGILEDLHLVGVKGVKRVATAQLYQINGEIGPAERDQVARDLLCDPVTQEFHDGNAATVTAGRRAAKDPCIAVDIWYKTGVTDVIGESVLKGLRDLKIDSVSEVRTGMRYRFWGLKSKGEAERLALAILANPLVHEQVIHAG